MTKAVLNKMFDNLLHIGNKTNYWNPRMKSYIYGSVNGIHVINLTKTASKIEEVKAELTKLHTEGKKILFVATKLQARDAVSKLASESGHYYVAEKWVPGLLTNFKTIKRRIATYIQLSKDAESGAFDVLTKKEKAAKMLELEKLDRAYRGVKEMKRTPDVIFVVDGIYEEQAVKEANSLNLTTFAILNTNGDDTVVSNCIPANTNSVKSVEYIAEELKGSLSGAVKAAPKSGKVRKVTDKKVSGAKKTPVKKAPVKKEEK
jgi:small subunit ribosomal protein S2